MIQDQFGKQGCYSFQEESGGLIKLEYTQRLLGLCYEGLKNREPVLMVGETGVGKTRIAQALAQTLSVPFYQINCHQTMCVEDLLGYMRPRGNTFVFQDGPLVQAFKNGGLLLIDEINLVDNSIIE